MFQDYIFNVTQYSELSKTRFSDSICVNIPQYYKPFPIFINISQYFLTCNLSTASGKPGRLGGGTASGARDSDSAWASGLRATVPRRDYVFCTRCKIPQRERKINELNM